MKEKNRGEERRVQVHPGAPAAGADLLIEHHLFASLSLAAAETLRLLQRQAQKEGFLFLFLFLHLFSHLFLARVGGVLLFLGRHSLAAPPGGSPGSARQLQRTKPLARCSHTNSNSDNNSNNNEHDSARLSRRHSTLEACHSAPRRGRGRFRPAHSRSRL